MAASAGGIYVDLGLNSAQFHNGLKKAETGLSGFGARAAKVSGAIRGAFAGIGAGLALGLGGVGLAGMFAGAKTAAADLSQIAAEAGKAGVAVEAFQELGYAAKGAMVNVDALTDGLKEMQLRADEFVVTGAGSGAEAFQRLGFSADELKTKLADPSALFEEIIDRLGRLDKASQIRISDELFGGTGGEQFVRLLDQGNGYIARMRQEARDTGNVLDAQLVQRAVEIDRAFAKLSSTVGTNLKGALVGVVSLMRDFTDMLNSTEAQSAGTLQRRIDLLKAAAENMRNSSAAFAIGGGQEGIDRRLAEAADLQRQLDSRPGTSITLNKPSGNFGDLSKVDSPAKTAAEDLAKAYDQIVLSAEQRIAQMGVEQQALGLTTAGAEALRVKTELLNELQRAGIRLTPEYAAKVEELAQRSGQAAAALEAQAAAQTALVDSLDEVRGTAYDVLGGYLSDVRNGVSQTDALNNALNRVLDTILEIGLQSVVKGLFGAPGTPQTGILDGLLSGLLGTFGGSKAVGGPVNAGQMYRVGERGPEMFVPDVAGRIVPNHVMAGGKGGGMAITYAPQVTIEAGASAEAVAQLRRMLEEDRKSFATRTVRVIQDAQRRNVRV